MTLLDDLAIPDVDRRLLVLVLVVVLVILGTGIGTFLPSDETDAEPSSTATPEPVATDSPTPTQTPTPTPTPESGGAVGPDDESTTTPTETATVEPDSGDDDDSGRDRDRAATDTPTKTPTPTPTATPTPTPTATPTPTPTPSPTPEPEGSLEGPSTWEPIEVSGALPGDSGNETATLSNDGVQNGQLRVASTTIIDHENGITEPESAVDDTPDEGELSEHLEVRLAFVEADGAETYLLGTAAGDDGYVALDDLRGRAPSSDYPLADGENVTVRADWRLPFEVGNEVQSDDVTVEIDFELRSPSE